MKGAAPSDVVMSDVYRAMYPFVGLQVVGLVLCAYFSEISLWLPRLARFEACRQETSCEAKGGQKCLIGSSRRSR